MGFRKSHKQKFHIKVTLDAGTGVKGKTDGYEVYGETTLRVTPVGVGGTNVVDIEGRLEGETTWTSIGTVTGTTSDTFDMSTYDYIRFNQTTSDGTGEVIASGFFNQVGSLAGSAASVAFKTIQTDAGTSPVADSAEDTLTITSSDASVTITGNSTTDTIDLSVTPGVTTPGSTTDNAIVRWNGTSGDNIQNSNVTIDDDGRISQNGLENSTIFGNNAATGDDLVTNYTTAFGKDCLAANTSGRFNTAVGYRALTANISQGNNVAVGYNAMATAFGAAGCVSIGPNNMALLTTGDFNISMGQNAMLFTTTGSRNISLGYNALYSNTTANNNIAIGYQAGYYGQTGGDNIYIGYHAGLGGSAANHSNNIFIGYQAGDSVTTGSDNIIIGYDEDLPSATTSDHLNIGGVIFGDISTSKEIGINVSASFGATLDVDQDSSTGAKPVLRLNQADIDDSFINFSGTTAADGTRSISTDTTEDSTKYGAIRIEINGTTKWIRIYDNES